MVNLKVIALLSVFLATFAQISPVALTGMNPMHCGNEDGNSVRIKRWTLMHHGYTYKTITYRISNYSKNHEKQDIDDLIQRASNTWTQHTDLKFIQKQPHEAADIDIRFAVKNHGHSMSFDGKSGILAHATKKFAHFDDEEDWKLRNEGRPNLYRSMIHEFGHCLGLGHSNVEEAIMYKNHNPEIFVLHDDDIKGIQEIYGEKKVPPPYSENLCKDPTFDTMFDTPDRKRFVFKKDKYYELYLTDIIDGPKPISEKWKDLPDSITAAFSQERKTFFFKSGQYWRFTGYEMDQGYPQKLNRWYSEIPDNFNDATVWEDGKVYFFRGSKYWMIDAFNEKYDIVTPGLLKDDWKGIPNHTDTVHYSKSIGYTLFFKNDSFYAYSTKKDWPEPYTIRTTSYFFGCTKSGIK